MSATALLKCASKKSSISYGVRGLVQLMGFVHYMVDLWCEAPNTVRHGNGVLFFSTMIGSRNIFVFLSKESL